MGGILSCCGSPEKEGVPQNAAAPPNAVAPPKAAADAPPTAAAAAAPEPPRPRPFAVSRNSHEAIRGALKDVQSAVAAGDLTVAKQEWEDFQRALKTHMAMEDNGIFPVMDAVFEDAITKAGFRGEHSKDIEEQEDVSAALASGDIPKITAVFGHFSEDHEKHLKHEEDVMMPLTNKMGTNLAERGAAANLGLLKPMLEHGDFPFYLNWVIVKLVKHKPADAVRMFVWALQYSSTEEQYASFLPVIKGAIPAEMWATMDKEFDLSAAGKVQKGQKSPFGHILPPICVE